MKLTGGALIVAGIAGLGFAIYKGWIKLPDLGSLLGSILPGDVGRGAQEVPGIPGAIGGATYNIFAPGDTTLKERADIIAPGIAATEDIPLDIAFHKAVAQEAAEDVIAAPFDTGFIGAITPPLSGFTIGAGFGVIDRWNKYLEGLPFSKRAAARQTEYETRALWMYEHPIESTIGFPAQIIHEITKPEGAPSAPAFTVLSVGTAALKDRIFPTSDKSWLQIHDIVTTAAKAEAAPAPPRIPTEPTPVAKQLMTVIEEKRPALAQYMQRVMPSSISGRAL